MGSPIISDRRMSPLLIHVSTSRQLHDKCSFFPQIIRDLNDLPDSLFSTAEMSDDCVSKFASLVRSRD